jgi:thiol-disulfide isomerase/thioredoxin
MKRKIWIFCVGLLFLAGLAAVSAQEKGVVLRYKYKPGQEIIYEYKEIVYVDMRQGEETNTHEIRTEGRARDSVLSISPEGVIEMAFYQEDKMVLHKIDGEESPFPEEIMTDLLWQKFNNRGQTVVEEDWLENYMEQNEIIEFPEEPIDVGSTWKTGIEEDYITYQVLAKETQGKDECYKIKSIRRMAPGENLRSMQVEMFLWFAIDKGYVVKFRGLETTTGKYPQNIDIHQKVIFMGTLLEEKSLDEAETISRRKQLEKLYAIEDAILEEKFDQAARDIDSFNKEFPHSPYKEVAASHQREVEEARQMAARPESLVDLPAPAFELPDFEGNKVRLADFKGRVVFLDFWATWCGPCVVAVPYVQALYEKYEDKGVVVIGMNVDDDRDKARQFAKEKGLTYIHLFAQEVGYAYSVMGIPTFFIIDQKGIVRYQEAGFAPGLEKKWEKEIDELLAERGGE